VVGRITHIADGAGTEDRLYGPLGEIVQETRAIPIQGGQVAHYTTQFTFDTWNRIAQMVYPIEVKKLTTDQPNGEVVQYFYDFGGLPERVHGNDDALEVAYASNIFYDKFGQRLSMTYGNGVVTNYAYRPDNRRLLNVQATLPVGYTFNNFNFSYDKVGNLLTLQNNVQPPLNFTGGSLGNAIGGPWQNCYAYDDLYRLISSNASFGSTVSSCLDTSTTNHYSFSQAYDSIHNITRKTQTAMQNSAVNPQITYDNAYTYPAAGSAHPHSPIYPNQFYTDFGGGSGNQFKHIFIGSERILTKKTRIAPDREHWYYHPDHLGSTAMVTNENDQLRQRTDAWHRARCELRDIHHRYRRHDPLAHPEAERRRALGLDYRLTRKAATTRQLHADRDAIRARP
jgi:hypothetical protein